MEEGIWPIDLESRRRLGMHRKMQRDQDRRSPGWHLSSEVEAMEVDQVNCKASEC
jgi:hypothetical protein